MTVCGWGRGGPSPSPAQCKERPLPNRFFCELHNADALARVRSDPKFTPEGKVRRWTATDMVSGSSRD